MHFKVYSVCIDVLNGFAVGGVASVRFIAGFAGVFVAACGVMLWFGVIVL